MSESQNTQKAVVGDDEKSNDGFVDEKENELLKSETPTGPYDVYHTPKGEIEKLDTGVYSTETSTLATRDTHQEVEPTEANEGTQERENDHAENIMHGINSFWALIYPIVFTMILASIVVVNFRSPELTQSMSSYLVYDEDSSEGGGKVLGKSLINALVIIGFVAMLTVLMVVLYMYNCFKLLVGYILVASALILGFEGGQLAIIVLVDIHKLPIDWPAFAFVLFNFGIVGVISIFYQKGTSKLIQHAYLVLVSVILAWQFSMWPEWTTWIFCSMFAVYDLCAVLTPCGPLRCLIGLIQKKQKPMPGLLYEAEVTDGVNGSSRNVNSSSEQSNPPTIESNETNPQIQNNHEVVYPPTYEILEELIERLKEFYITQSPQDEHKASAAAERFFNRQQELWPLLYHKYKICSCSTQNKPCIVIIESRKLAQRQQEEEEDKTIKLGLGDFIFYSVLVGRAAMYDFSTMVSSFLCIIMGLGATLFLLSVLHKPLPALPISIFLATIFYFWTRYLFIDYLEFMGDAIMIV